MVLKNPSFTEMIFLLKYYNFCMKYFSPQGIPYMILANLISKNHQRHFMKIDTSKLRISKNYPFLGLGALTTFDQLNKNYVYVNFQPIWLGNYPYKRSGGPLHIHNEVFNFKFYWYNFRFKQCGVVKNHVAWWIIIIFLQILLKIKIKKP